MISKKKHGHHSRAHLEHWRGEVFDENHPLAKGILGPLLDVAEVNLPSPSQDGVRYLTILASSDER